MLNPFVIEKVQHHAFSNALKNILEILKIFKYQLNVEVEFQVEEPVDH